MQFFSQTEDELKKIYMEEGELIGLSKFEKKMRLSPIKIYRVLHQVDHSQADNTAGYGYCGWIALYQHWQSYRLGKWVPTLDLSRRRDSLTLIEFLEFLWANCSSEKVREKINDVKYYKHENMLNNTLPYEHWFKAEWLYDLTLPPANIWVNKMDNLPSTTIGSSTVMRNAGVLLSVEELFELERATHIEFCDSHYYILKNIPESESNWLSLWQGTIKKLYNHIVIQQNL